MSLSVIFNLLSLQISAGHFPGKRFCTSHYKFYRKSLALETLERKSIQISQNLGWI